MEWNKEYVRILGITVGVAMLILSVTAGAEANTRTVCHSGCNYSSIQYAINIASTGDTILVKSGTYYENVDVNKPLILKGDDTGEGKPVVDGREIDSAINLSAGSSTLDGFEATNGSDAGAGIMIVSDNNIIKNNNVDANNNDGIDMYYSSNNTLSSNNALNNNCDGIYMNSSSNNTLSSNNVSNNICYGIDLDSSGNNILSGNNASNNYDGIDLYNSSNNMLNVNNASNNTDGIYLDSSSNNTLSGNNDLNNNGYGIYLGSSSNNTLSGNNASNNNYGIYQESSDNNILSTNYVSNNYDGIDLYYSGNNLIYNNFFNNTNNYNIISASNNFWNITKTKGNNIIGNSYLGGNLWAYPNGTGFSQLCADIDGICDSPYVLDSNNIDYLPLAYNSVYAGGVDFDTGAGGYPSIMGTHNGTIMLNQDRIVSKMYTYPSAGTGGHSEYVKIYNNSWSIEANWSGYQGDWHNITFNKPFILKENVIYSYTIRTGSYPQIIHNSGLSNSMGTITSSDFIDANGRHYFDWIPAIKLTG